MSAPADLHKILFVGPMGAGKTTAITCISDEKPITTEADNSDTKQSKKTTTTVAMDYGAINLGDDIVHLYGIPGQERFKFMWPILARGSMGCIFLIDETRPDPMQDLKFYLQEFKSLVENKAFVIGICKTKKQGCSVEKYNNYFVDNNIYAPVFEVDVRDKSDVLILLEVILINQEIQG